MLKELVKINSTKLEIISVYRIVLILFTSLYLNIKVIYILSIILLIAYSLKESLIYASLLIIILIINSINIALIPIGIVEKQINSYYICDSILYKAKVYDNSIEIGDIIYYKQYNKLDDIVDLKKNIKFEIEKCEKITSLSIKKNIYYKVQNLDINTKLVLNKFLYNIKDYDDLTYNLGYGLAIYYLFKEICKKNKNISFILSIIYSLIFCFDVKLYLLFLEYFTSKFKNSNKLFIIIILVLINRYLIYNYSILIPLLLNLYNYFDYKIDFKTYFSIIQSILFGYVNVLNAILYKYIIKYQCVLVILSIITLFIPEIKTILILVIEVYEKINNLNVNIRGGMSIWILLIYFFLIKYLKITSLNLKYLLCLLLIYLNIFNPFLTVDFIDVGQGDATLIHLPMNKGNVLIDTGSKYNYYKLKKYLYSKGLYTIDYLVITHNDEDHNGNIDSITNDFNVINLINKPIDISIDKLKLKSLYIGEFDNDNDSSLIYWMDIDDVSFLFTGDISYKADSKLIKKYGYIDVNILKVSHHGSKTGSSDVFISNTLPNIAVISTSGQYNHPNTEIIDRLDRYLCDRYITKNKGNIVFYMLKPFSILATSSGDFAIIK